MATLAEFRAQHPQYNDMSDDDLASSLHRKFYSDLPRDDFYKKIGFQSAQPQTWMDTAKDGSATAADTAYGALSGINRGLVGAVTLPYRGLDWLGEKATGGDFLPDADKMPLFKPYIGEGNPQPQTEAGRYAHSVGEAVGGSALPTAGIMSKAEKWSKLLPATRTDAIKQTIAQPFVNNPKAALAADVVANTGAGLAAQAAAESGATGPEQMTAAIAGGMSPYGATVAASKAASAVAPYISPLMARWQADLAALRHKGGIHASGGGSGEPIPPKYGPGARAQSDEMIAQAMHRGGLSTDAVQGRIDAANRASRYWNEGQAQQMGVLADQDKALQRLSGAAARALPEADNTITAAIAGRQTGITPTHAPLPPEMQIPTRPMLSQPMTGGQAQEVFGTRFHTPESQHVPMGQGERLGDALRRSLLLQDKEFHGHGQNAYRTNKLIEERMRRNGDRLYKAAWSRAEDFDLLPAFEELRGMSAMLNDARAQSVFNRAARLFTHVEGNGAPYGGAAADLKKFDLAKQRLDGLIETYKRAGDNFIYPRLTQFKQSLLDAVHGGDRLSPTRNAPYGKARDAWSNEKRSQDLIELGRKLFRGDPDEGIDAFNALETAADQKLVRLGYYSEYTAAAKNMKRGADKTQLFDNARQQEILSHLIPRTQTATGRQKIVKGELAEFADRPERFGQFIGNEQQMVRTRNEALGNSKTAQRQQDDDVFVMMSSVSQAVENLKSGRLTAAGINYASHLAEKLFGMRADTAAALAHSLFTANPREQAQILARVKDRMGPDRFMYFTRMLEQYQASVVPTMAGAAGAAAGQQ